MQHFDLFFDNLNKLCKKSKLDIYFAGFTNDKLDKIDKNLTTFCKKNSKMDTVILYVQDDDMTHLLQDIAELRIMHSYCIDTTQRAMNPSDKYRYNNILKKFCEFIKNETAIELDYNGNTKQPLYLDCYFDLHHFIFYEEKLTNAFKMLIQTIFQQNGRNKKYSDLYLEVLQLYYDKCGIEPHLIDEHNILNYGSNSTIRKLTLKKLNNLKKILESI
jgi:hypothetical protein